VELAREKGIAVLKQKGELVNMNALNLKAH